MPIQLKNSFVKYAAFATILSACIILGGWLFNIPVLTGSSAPNVSTKFNTALCFLFSGISLLQIYHNNSRSKKIAIASAASVTLFGLLTLCQYIFGWNFGLDQLFWTDRFIPKESSPGRMSPAAALTFILLGGSLLIISTRRWLQAIPVLISISIAVVLLAVISYDFKSSYLRDYPFFSRISIFGAIIFIILSAGILKAANPAPIRFPLEWKLIASIFLIILVLFISFNSFNNTSSNFIDTSKQLEHSREVLYDTEQLLSLSLEMQNSARGYFVTGDNKILSLFYKAEASIYPHLSQLKTRIKDNPLQQRRIDSLRLAITLHANFEKKLIGLRRNNQTGEMQEQVASGKGKEFMDNIRILNARLQQEENRLLAIRTRHNNQSIEDSIRTILLFQIVIVLILVFMYLFIRENLRARDNAEDDLKESKKWFSTTLSSIGDAVIATDNQGMITFINTVAKNLTGWGEEARGQSLETVFNIINEHTRKVIENPVNKVLKEGKTFGTANHTILIRKDKTELAIDDSAAPILDIDGKIKGVVLVFRDVTEQKKAEASRHYNALLMKNISDAVISTDENLVIKSWNKAAEEIFGYTAEEAIGQKGSAVLKTQVSADQRIINMAVLREYNYLKDEFECISKSGKSIFILASINVIRNEDNVITGYVAVHKDITERKKMETRLTQFNEALEKKIKEKTEEISHILERVSDGFVAVGTDWNYTYLNTKAVERLKMDPGIFLGRNIWTVNPDEVGTPFYHAAQRALKDQEFMQVENYSPVYHRWIEYNIYPSSEGLSIYVRDITEKKKAQEELSKERNLLRTLIDNLPDYICVKDPHLRHLINNKANVELIGASTEEETLGKTVEDYFGSEIAQSFMEDDRKVLETKKPVLNREEIIYTQNGETRWLLTTKVPLMDIDKNVLGLVGISRDISDRKKTEQEIIREKEFCNKIIDSLPGIFYLFDQDGKFIRWNKDFESLSGYSAEEISTMHPIDFFGDPEKKYIRNRIEIAFAEGESNAEAEFMTKSGKRIPFYFTGNFILFENRPCLLGVAIDISRRKKAEYQLRASEKKYKLLFESNPLPMWMLTIPERDFLDVNRAAVLQYGYSREEFLAMNVKDIRPEEDMEHFLAQPVSLRSGIYRAGIWRHRKKDGTIIHAEIITYDVIFEKKPIRLVLAIDVSEKIRAEEQIKQTSEQLRQLSARLQEIREQERTNIAREIHDELGQRLTVLKMDLAWLNKRIDTEDEIVNLKIQDSLGMVDNTIKIIRKIATDLRPSLLDDLGLIAAIEWHSKDFESRSGIKINFKSNLEEMDLPPNIATGLFRIYQEALTNVARHAWARNVKSVLRKHDDSLELVIADNGKGFDTTLLGKKETLGLLGMKERAAMMGGKLEIASMIDKGTEVTVIVPIPNQNGQPENA